MVSTWAASGAVLFAVVASARINKYLLKEWISSMRRSYKWQGLSPGVSGVKTDDWHGAQRRQLHLQGPARKGSR